MAVAFTVLQGCNDPDGVGFVNGARVPVAFRDDCPAVSGANYPGGCPSTDLIVAMINSLATLTAYSDEQEGQFTTIILQGVATPPPTCQMNAWGFCFGE